MPMKKKTNKIIISLRYNEAGTFEVLYCDVFSLILEITAEVIVKYKKQWKLVSNYMF